MLDFQLVALFWKVVGHLENVGELGEMEEVDC